MMEHPLLSMIRADLRPALGVTEPGAIACAAALARRYAPGEIYRVTVVADSGIYKNAFTCGIPGSVHTGILHAAALGVCGGDPDRGLEVLDAVTEEAKRQAEALVRDGNVTTRLRNITSEIFLAVTVETAEHSCTVTVAHTHLGVVKIEADGAVIFEKQEEIQEKTEIVPEILRYSFEELYDLAKTAPIEELSFLREAYRVNLALFETGLADEKTVFTRHFFEKNGKMRISEDVLATAQLLTCGALEARVLGLDAAAMSLTGSGAHGILATLPLYAWQQVFGLSEEALLRATLLSALVTTYIKEYSGKLSAFCGCAIASGTGTACGLTLLQGGNAATAARAIRNMAASVTGMICDGGNHGCAMKGVVAVDAAYRSAELAVAGFAIEPEHGICGDTPEKTMSFMGQIADPGMVRTEAVILDILRRKNGE